MPMVLLIKSKPASPQNEEGGLSTFEKLKAILELRVKEAKTDAEREDAQRRLDEFIRPVRE